MSNVRVGATAGNHLHLEGIGPVDRSFLPNSCGHGTVRPRELDPHLTIAIDDTVQERVGRLQNHVRPDSACQCRRS